MYLCCAAALRLPVDISGLGRAGYIPASCVAHDFTLGLFPLKCYSTPPAARYYSGPSRYYTGVREKEREVKNTKYIQNYNNKA